ncbi:MAG: hypothetical protein Q8N34_03230 [Gammaproteobacteria bacterium]|nr:hypothetical protein [Gammaproteobacteria bacterium]
MPTTTVPASINRPATTSSQAGAVISKRHSHLVDSSAEFTGAGDKIALGVLPAGHEIVDCILEGGDLDSGTAVVITVGSEDDPDLLITSSTVCQAGGIARMNNPDGPKFAAVDVDTIIYMHAGTPPGTDIDAVCALTLMYRAKQSN